MVSAYNPSNDVTLRSKVIEYTNLLIELNAIFLIVAVVADIQSVWEHWATNHNTPQLLLPGDHRGTGHLVPLEYLMHVH